MKKLLSIILITVMIITSFQLTSFKIKAEESIPIVYIKNTVASANTKVITVALTSKDSSTITVSYRILAGSASDSTNSNITDDPLITIEEDLITFSGNEIEKSVTISEHVDPSSYENEFREYYFQLYDATGNVIIDKNNDFETLTHTEPINNVYYGENYELYSENTMVHVLENSGDMIRFPSDGTTWSTNVSSAARYWHKIGVESYDTYIKSDMYTDDARVLLIYDINVANDGYIIEINGDGWGGPEGWFNNKVLGPRRINSTDKIEIVGQVFDAAGNDKGAFKNLSIYGQPVDNSGPVVKEIMYTPGKYSEGQEIVIAVLYNEIVTITSGNESSVRIPIIADDGTTHYAEYDTGDGTDILSFVFTVPMGKKDSALRVSSNSFHGEAYVKDIAGNDFTQTSFDEKISGNVLASNISYDGTLPSINSITANSNNTELVTGNTVLIDVTFDRKVKLLGTPQLRLSNGKIATGNKTTTEKETHRFSYTIGSDPSEDTSGLYVTELIGTTVIDEIQNVGFEAISGTNILANNIKIDNTGPVISIQYLTDITSEALSQQIKVTATDAIAGLDNISQFSYSIQSASYSSTHNLGESLEIEGTNPVKVYIKVVDDLGNISTVVTDYIYFDQTAPTISFTYPDSADGLPVSKGRISIQLTEEVSMENNIHYTWKNESEISVSEGNLAGFAGSGVITQSSTLDQEVDGRYKLIVDGQDSNGNTFAQTSGYIYIDKMVPTVISREPENTNQKKKEYTITITASDDNGINTDGKVRLIEYQWVIGGVEKSWHQLVPDENDRVSFQSENGNLSDSAYYNLKVHDSADDAILSSESNILEYQSDMFTFDNQAPVIQLENGDFNQTYGNFTTTITTNDAINSISEVKYVFISESNQIAIEDSRWKVLGTDTGSVSKLDGNGTFYLHVFASDIVGNTSYTVSDPVHMDNVGVSGIVDIQESKTNQDTITLNLENPSGEPNVSYWVSENAETPGTIKPFNTSDVYTFSDTSEGVKTIYVGFIDQYDNQTITSDTVVFDKTAPTGEISYNITELTKEDVISSLVNISDDVSSTDNITINAQNHTFDVNGSYIFSLTDQAGNTTNLTANVTWIDKVLPQVLFNPNSDINPSFSKDVVINTSKSGLTLTQQYRIIDENNQVLEPYVTFESGDNIHLDKDVPVYVEVAATDELGNQAVVKSGLFYTDNLEPIATITYSTTNPTNNDVIATISFDETTTVTNNGGSITYRFVENGVFEYEYSDIAGNTGTIIAEVDWINKALQMASIDVTETEITNIPYMVNVSVEALMMSKIGVVTLNEVELVPTNTVIREVDGENVVYEATYMVDQNGVFNVEILDVSTLDPSFESVDITNFDLVPPEVYFTKHIEDPTMEDIRVTLTAFDLISEPIVIVEEPVVPIDEVYVFTENGEYSFKVEDSLGNQGEYILTIDNIDRDISTHINYDIETFTNQDVIVTVYSDDEDIYVENNFGSDSYVFTENGSFIFEVHDFAGNTETIEAIVDYIDKIGTDYSVNISEKEKTNEPIMLTILPEDKIKQIVSTEGLESVTDKANQFVINENGLYHFIVTDFYGNEKNVYKYIDNVDTTAPLLDYVLRLNLATGNVFLNEGEAIEVACESIRIDFSDEERYSVISYDASLEYDESAHTFIANQNGTYTFVAEDLAGNQSEKVIELTGIDQDPPEVSVVYSIETMTNKPVVVTLSSDEDIHIVNNFNRPYKVFTENGEYSFIVSDIAGNRTTIVAVVNNIDKDSPVIKAEYSITTKTNQNVIVTLTSDETFEVIGENVTTIEVNDSYTYTFTYSHGRYFVIKDLAGNQTIVETVVDYIDKEAPNIIFTNDEVPMISLGDVDYNFALLASADSVDVDRIEVNTEDVNFNVGGIYEAIFTVFDDIGNHRSRKMIVEILDPNQPLIVRINGFNPGYKVFMLGEEIIIETYNVHESQRIYYLEGGYSKTQVKQSGKLLDGNVINVNESGWYSILVYDKDFNTRFYKIFMAR